MESVISKPFVPTINTLGVVKTYSTFGSLISDSLHTNGVRYASVSSNAVDNDAPLKTSNPMWYNVLIFGPNNRKTIIAFEIFSEGGNRVFVQIIHDTNKSKWKEFTLTTLG